MIKGRTIDCDDRDRALNDMIEAELDMFVKFEAVIRSVSAIFPMPVDEMLCIGMLTTG